ncbi:unnamed protein product [Darwinula stevensoni]|uniref:Uncharacterized protein n=1 Tax=Darwinula stevensoni TaxID=69355 RepID=A0A7R9FP47_9CRUS|nr:unnamed protein product [Darwinula stevensoni]CAG0897454.1 unnamed protein product [Darwinula stevensoni]
MAHETRSRVLIPRPSVVRTPVSPRREVPILRRRTAAPSRREQEGLPIHLPVRWKSAFESHTQNPTTKKIRVNFSKGNKHSRRGIERLMSGNGDGLLAFGELLNADVRLERLPSNVKNYGTALDDLPQVVRDFVPQRASCIRIACFAKHIPPYALDFVLTDGKNVLYSMKLFQDPQCGHVGHVKFFRLAIFMERFGTSVRCDRELSAAPTLVAPHPLGRGTRTPKRRIKPAKEIQPVPRKRFRGQHDRGHPPGDVDRHELMRRFVESLPKTPTEDDETPNGDNDDEISFLTELKVEKKRYPITITTTPLREISRMKNRHSVCVAVATLGLSCGTLHRELLKRHTHDVNTSVDGGILLFGESLVYVWARVKESRERDLRALVDGIVESLNRSSPKPSGIAACYHYGEGRPYRRRVGNVAIDDHRSCQHTEMYACVGPYESGETGVNHHVRAERRVTLAAFAYFCSAKDLHPVMSPDNTKAFSDFFAHDPDRYTIGVKTWHTSFNKMLVLVTLWSRTGEHELMFGRGECRENLNYDALRYKTLAQSLVIEGWPTANTEVAFLNSEGKPGWKESDAQRNRSLGFMHEQPSEEEFFEPVAVNFITKVHDAQSSNGGQDSTICVVNRYAFQRIENIWLIKDYRRGEPEINTKDVFAEDGFRFTLPVFAKREPRRFDPQPGPSTAP